MCLSFISDFLLFLLENIAFEDALPHNKQAALGASYFIELGRRF